MRSNPEPRDSASAAVDALLIQAINSGASTPMAARDWERIRIDGLKLAQIKRESSSPQKND
jgi:hypothetical protein